MALSYEIILQKCQEINKFCCFLLKSGDFGIKQMKMQNKFVTLSR